MRLAAYAALLLLAFSVSAVAIYTLSETGRRNLAGLVSGLASSPERQVEIGGISGIWSGALRIDSVAVADAKGEWLVARDIALDWSPGALLGWRFDARSLRVARIEVARRPESPAAEETAESSGFSLPIPIRLEKLDIAEIALDAAVAGEAALLSAAGSLDASDRPLLISAALDVARLDGPQARFVADLDFAPDENRLKLDVTASEQSGGLLARLLRLPGNPAVELSLSGQGPLADWAGRGALSVDGRMVTSLSATHREDEAGRRLFANGEGDFQRFLPENLAVLAQGTTFFDLAARLPTEGGVRIEHAVLETDTLSATGDGRYDPSGESDLALEMAARGEAVQLVFGGGETPALISFERASLSLSGSGEAPAVVVEARLASAQGAGFGFSGIAARAASGGFSIAERSGPMMLRLTADAVGTVNATLAPLVAGGLEITAETELSSEALSIASLSVKNRAVTLSANGTARFEGPAGSAAFDGVVRADALPDAARKALGDTVRLSGRAELAAGGDVSMPQFRIESGPLAADGTARLTAGTLDAAISGAYADIARLVDQAAGEIAFAVTAKGDPATPDVSATLSSARIEGGGTAITGLSLEAAGKVDPAAPAAQVRLSGEVEGQKLQGEAFLRSVDGANAIEDLLLTVGDNRISGRLDLDQAFVPVGTLDIHVPDIAPLAAMALEQVEGDLEGSVRFGKADGVALIDVDARIGSFRRGDIAGRGIVIGANVADYLGAPAVSGRIRAEEVRSGDTQIGAIDIRLERSGEWTGFAGGATVADIPAKAEGRVRLADGRTTIELASAGGAFRGISASLARPTVIVIADGVTRLDDLAVALSGGTATASGTIGDALDIGVRLSALPLSLVNGFAPGLGAGGTLNGTASLKGPPAAPAVTYDVTLRAASVSQMRGAGLGAVDIRSDGRFAGGRLNFRSDVSDAAGLRIGGGGTVDTAGPVTLNLDFSGNVPFAMLARALAEQGLSLTGSANVDVGIRGTAASPVIGGTIRSSGGRFLDARSGIAINELAIDVGLGGGVATLRSLTGELSTGGSLSASGTVGIGAGSGFPADLSLRAVNGRYTDGRIVTANFSGDLKVTGPLAGAPLLSGDVALGRTVITIPEKLPASLAALDVKHRNAPEAVRRQAEALRPATSSSGGGGGMMLDVTVNAPQQIFIVGRGVDTELGGSIRLTGPVSAPVAIGTFDMRRGRLSILGKRLTFTHGSIGFAGSLIPELDLAAETAAGDATATVAVTGSALNPRFAFSSVPSLPEDEVMARVVFGRSMSNLSPLQIAQLAAAAAQLAGVGGSTSLLENLRGQLGVDDLDLRTDEETGRAAVAVGKYLNDRTYLEFEKGEGAGSGKATINLDIGRGVKLRGEARDDGETRGGIFFEREY